MSMCNNILCHNNIAAGMVSCRNILSIELVSRDEQPICADGTAKISAAIIIAVSQYNLYGE
jgi:hypothetical protein